MVFGVGKYYRHTTGHMLHVLCEAETKLFGNTLIAETYDDSEVFTAIGKTEDHSVNYTEISKEDWDIKWDVEQIMEVLD